MRLFVALPLPGRARDAVAALATQWRPLGWPVRWVAPESLHLTLRFLGEVAPGAMPAIRNAVEDSARGTGAIELVPRAVEFHPSGPGARVLWLALEAVPALELLAHRLEQGLASHASRELEGPFRPHITLARVARDARVPGSAVRLVAAAAVPDAFLAQQAVLYQSELGNGPPRYLEQHTVPLEA